jgi:hypothetical protein
MSFENTYRTWHTKISYLKSGVRLGASGTALYFMSDASMAAFTLALGFGIAEVLGVLEEWM